jgi:hypothetical protein
VFHRRCIVRSCTRVATSNVEVWWRILTMHVVRRDRGSGRTTARAGVCPGHEHALALGELLPGRKLGCAPVGVYTWRPGAEEIIEAILRGKVMVAA